MVRLKKVSIQNQLLVAFLFITGLLGVFGVIIFSAIKDIQKGTHEVIVLQEQLSRAQSIMWFDEILTQSLRNYILTGDSIWQKRYDEYVPQLDAVIAAVGKNEGADSQKELFKRQKQANDQLVAMETKASELMKTKNKAQALQIIDSHFYMQWKRQYAITIHDYYEQSKNRLQTAQEKIIGQIENAILFIVVSIITAIIMGVFGSLIVAKHLSKSLKKITTIAKSIAEGNFLIMASNKNSTLEIEQLLNAFDFMIERFKTIIMTIKKTTDNVSFSSQTLNENAEKMQQGATIQAVTSKEVLVALEDVTVKIQQNASNALQTEKLAIQASAEAEETGKTVLETVMLMQDIAKKLAVIEDIAAQTHILSLNASLEAERAREYGRGFAVVAQQVRDLALHSKEAAVEINQLIQNSTAISKKAKTMLTQLVPDIQQTAELVHIISVVSKEQHVGVEKVTQAIQQLDYVSQQNSITSQDLFFTSENLAEQAVQLQNTIAFFKWNKD